jgi:hypothetical protein
MQKAIRNTSGKPVSVESLDKREEARHKPSANPVVKDEAKLDRERDAVRIAQARAEQHQGSDDAAKTTEFNVRQNG